MASQEFKASKALLAHAAWTALQEHTEAPDIRDLRALPANVALRANKAKQDMPDKPVQLEHRALLGLPDLAVCKG